MRDLFEKCRRFSERPPVIRAEERQMAADLFGDVSPPENAGPWMAADRRRLLQFSSNDYLGLAMHPEVRARAMEVVRRYGIGCPMGSRLMTGTTQEHLALEQELAAFKRCQAAVTFSSGALAMMGTLACLSGPQDMVLLDEHAHATLSAGAKISGAEIAWFRHNDLEHLESLLAKYCPRKAVGVVVDGVYSMQGDLGPLPGLVALKDHYRFRLIVDDAHGTGVFGAEGRGTAAHFDVERGIDLQCGTFSKALGTAGGFVAGKRPIIEFLRYNAPTLIFTKAMPLAVVEATRAALPLLRQADAKRQRLWDNRARLQHGLRRQGFAIGETQTPITPVQFAGSDALYAAYELRGSYGIWAAPVLYPAVPWGCSILRVIPTACHTDGDIDYLVDSLTKVLASRIVGELMAV